MSSTRAGRSAPRLSALRLRPSGACSSPSSPIAATASLIRPDYVGKNLPTTRDERIQVQLVEVDEVDQVLLIPAEEETHG